MTKNLVYVGIIVLAVVAIYLGYKIYQQQIGLKSQTKTPGQQIQSNTSPKPAAPQTTQPTFVLNFPGPNSSDEETRKFAEDVQANAKETGELNISQCKPNPQVLKVKLGSEFKIKNSDLSEHKIYIAGKEKFSASPNSTVTAKAAFDKGSGTYGYGCDSDNTLAGAFFVVE